MIIEIIIIVSVILLAILVMLFLERSHHTHFHIFKHLHYLPFIKKKFKTPLKFVKHLHFSTKKIIKNFKKIIQTKRNIIIGTIFSLLNWILHFFIVYFLFLSFGAEVSIVSIGVIYVVSILLGSLSPLPGGMGVTESTMTILYAAIGINPALAFLVAFLSRVGVNLLSIIIGGASLFHLRVFLKEK